MNLNLFRKYENTTHPVSFAVENVGLVQIKGHDITVSGARPTFEQLVKIHNYLKGSEQVDTRTPN